jgi:hypothetical protein
VSSTASASATAVTRTSWSAQIVPLIVSLVISIPILALASWGDESETNPLRRFFVTLAVAGGCGLIVFLWAVPRAEASARIAPVLAVLALVTLPAFWLGVTAVLAVGAITAARRSPTRSLTTAASTVAAGLALIAVVIVVSISF